jgi:hypothetical protein
VQVVIFGGNDPPLPTISLFGSRSNLLNPTPCPYCRTMNEFGTTLDRDHRKLMIRPDSPANPITGFEHRHYIPSIVQLPRCGQPCCTSPDH